MRIALVALCAAFAIDASAATSYRVTFNNGAIARVLADGAKLRADFGRADAVHPFNTLLSEDGGETWIAVNDALQTWYPTSDSPFAVHSRYFIGVNLQPQVKKVQWSVARKTPETIAGQLSYVIEDRVMGSLVRSRSRATVEVWPMNGAPTLKWPAKVPIRTGIAAVDEQLSRSSELLGEFPRRIVVTVTRQYEGGGTPTSETFTIDVDDVQDVAPPDPARFTRPASYREQAPAIGIPGT